jgi:hypothetical protein
MKEYDYPYPNEFFFRIIPFHRFFCKDTIFYERLIQVLLKK